MVIKVDKSEEFKKSGKKLISEYDAEKWLDKIEKNSGLKAVAKLCLNSLWGKFGQRQNKTQVIVIYSVKELWDLLLNDQLTDFHISVIDENRLMVAYRMKDVCIPNSHNTNIYIACNAL